MASITRRGRRFWLSFYYSGRRYRTSLGDVRKRDAEAVKYKADGLLSLLKAGLGEPPHDGAIVDYVLGRTPAVTAQRRSDVGRPGVETPRQTDVTVEELLREYRSYAEPPSRAPSTYKTEMIHVGHFEKFMAELLALPLGDISVRIFDEYKRYRSAEVSTDTVNKELQTLRQVFALGVRYGYMAGNPLDDVRAFEKSQAEKRFLTGEEIEEIEASHGELTGKERRELRRFRYLSPDEIGKLLDLASDTDLYPALATAAYTGMRRGEILQLEWADIDLDAGRIWVRSRKGSRTHRYQTRDVDVHPKLREILVRYRENCRGRRYVLSGKDSQPWNADRAHRALKDLVRGTEFEDIGFHTLKHSFSSNLAAVGVDDRTIDYFMGHQTVEMRRRYQHLFPDARRAAIEKLGY